MARATVSTKFQIVIPKAVRQQVRLRTGQTLEIIAKGGIITLVPDRPLSELRGYLRGMKTGPIREKKDRV